MQPSGDGSSVAIGPGRVTQPAFPADAHIATVLEVARRNDIALADLRDAVPLARWLDGHRLKKACVSSSAMPASWSTQPSRVRLMQKVRMPIVDAA